MSKLALGDIVELNLDPAIGHEKNKTRPCLVVEPGGTPLDLIIVLPITDASSPYKKSGIFVLLENYVSSGLKKESSVDTYQIRAVSKKRIVKIIGKATKNDLFRVRHNLARILEIDDVHL